MCFLVVIRKDLNMLFHQNSSRFFLILSLFLGMSFSLQAQAPVPQTNQPVQQAPAPTPAPTPAPMIVAPAMPDTGAETLSFTDQQDLAELMSQGACPCDTNPDESKKKSLLICIQEKSCPSATALAKFGVQKYKEGLSKDQVTDAIIDKYIAENVPPAVFDLSKGPYKGNPKAKVVIVEFADFECPHCAVMKNVLKELFEKHNQDLVIYFKQFPLPFHANAKLASQATLAAHKQGAFWQMHDLIFDNQSTLNPEIFKNFATQLGLNVEKFLADMNDPAIQVEIENQMKEGMQNGLTGTPTVFINGRLYRGETNVEKLSAKVLEALKAK
jgi:protein-disulfide isomerase